MFPTHCYRITSNRSILNLEIHQPGGRTPPGHCTKLTIQLTECQPGTPTVRAPDVPGGPPSPGTWAPSPRTSPHTAAAPGVGRGEQPTAGGRGAPATDGEACEAPVSPRFERIDANAMDWTRAGPIAEAVEHHTDPWDGSSSVSGAPSSLLSLDDGCGFDDAVVQHRVRLILGPMFAGKTT
jgi:hypothetical protein